MASDSYDDLPKGLARVDFWVYDAPRYLKRSPIPMADLLRQLNEETPTRRVAQWAGVPVPPLLDRESISPPREEPL